MRGYIAMLATREEYRGHGIASKLVRMAVEKMIEKDADEVEPPQYQILLIATNRLKHRRLPSKPKSTISRRSASMKT